MKTIKVIDLLNALANEEYENLPKKLRFAGKEMFLNDDCYWYDDCETEVADIWAKHLLNRELEIIEDPILDAKEREYLSVIIRPFRNKVNFIKIATGINTSYLAINISNDGPIVFPCFKKGTMYKGMEIEKEYTLEELGL